MEVSMKHVYVVILLATQWSAANAASPAERILVAPDARVAEIARSIAETLAKGLPTQLDQTTRLISTVFVPSTKTFIYSYESTIMLDSTRLKPYLISKMCSDSNLHAFMARGIMIRHQYAFPSGQAIAIIEIRIKDC
jgi:hypothetical protein